MVKIKKEVSLEKLILNLTKKSYELQQFENILIFELRKISIYFLMFEKVYQKEKIRNRKKQ